MCALAVLQKARARAAAWLPRVELRRRHVLLCTGQCAREDHAARTTICTAMQHPEMQRHRRLQARTSERSCARPALQGLPAQREDLRARCGCYVRQGLTDVLGRHVLLQGWRAGVLSRVVSSASSPRRTALIVWSGGVPRCSTSGLSPSTSSPPTHVGESESSNTREPPSAIE
jgi:hypothetical protein